MRQQLQQQLLRDLRQARDVSEATALLYDASTENPSMHFERGNVPAHLCELFFSLKFKKETLLQERRLYAFLDSLELNSAPRLLEQIHFLEKGGCSLLHVEGMPQEGINEKNQYRSDISSEAAERFILDLERLADAGWYHPWVCESTDHWYVHPHDGRILVFAWDPIRPIRAGEKAEIRRSIAALCLGEW